MSWIQKKVTPAVVRANRDNSQKSTGPRTQIGKQRSGRNAGRYFVFGQVTAERMLQLGEDPAEFEKLLHSLRSAIAPCDGFEEMLVEEFAVTWWRLARLRRAESGMLASQRDGVEVQISKVDNGGVVKAPKTPFTFRNIGPVASTQCFEKYRQIIYVLDSVGDGVKKSGFTQAGLAILDGMQSMYPDTVGSELIHQYLTELKASPSCSPENSESAQVTGDGSGERDKKARETFLTALQRDIQKIKNHLKTSVVLRATLLPSCVDDALLMLPEGDSDRIARYESMFQRAFERLQKQLIDWRNRRGWESKK
jgi:hypothetical protein